MKKLFFVLVVLQLFSLNLMCAQDVYAMYAKRWCSTYIYDESGRLRISFEDVKAIRELVQLSADRAAITLKAQNDALSMATMFWQVWQNISQTRLNPSHERPYCIDRAACLSLEAYWDLVCEQESVSKQYSEVAQRVVYGGVLTHQSAQDAVAAMRAQARVYMVDSLADVKKQLGGLYAIAFNKSQEVDTFADDMSFQRGLNLGEFVLSYVPNLAMHSFVHADKAHNHISSEGWQMLEKVQRIGNQVWDAIESSRYAFYRALLDELDARAL